MEGKKASDSALDKLKEALSMANNMVKLPSPTMSPLSMWPLCRLSAPLRQADWLTWLPTLSWLPGKRRWRQRSLTTTRQAKRVWRSLVPWSSRTCELDTFEWDGRNKLIDVIVCFNRFRFCSPACSEITLQSAIIFLKWQLKRRIAFELLPSHRLCYHFTNANTEQHIAADPCSKTRTSDPWLKCTMTLLRLLDAPGCPKRLGKRAHFCAHCQRNNYQRIPSTRNR
jgi:hypothetical protein